MGWPRREQRLPGSPRAAVCGGVRFRLPLDQADSVILRVIPKRVHLPLEVATVPGEALSWLFQKAVRRPGDQDGGSWRRGSGAPASPRCRGTLLSLRVTSHPCWLVHDASSWSEQPSTYAEAKLSGRPAWYFRPQLVGEGGAFSKAPSIRRPRARITVCGSCACVIYPALCPATPPGAGTLPLRSH